MNITSMRPSIHYKGENLTGFAHSPDDVQDMLKMVGGAPSVIKLLEGTQGIGMVLAETQKAAESVIEAFMGLKAKILIQEFIEAATQKDVASRIIQFIEKNHGPHPGQGMRWQRSDPPLISAAYRSIPVRGEPSI